MKEDQNQISQETQDSTETEKLFAELERLANNDETDLLALAGEYFAEGSDTYALYGTIICILQAIKQSFLHNPALNRSTGIIWTAYEVVGEIVWQHNTSQLNKVTSYDYEKKLCVANTSLALGSTSLGLNTAYLTAHLIGSTIAGPFYSLLTLSQTYESWYCFSQYAYPDYEIAQKRVDDPIYYLHDRIDRYEEFSRRAEHIAYRINKGETNDEDQENLNILNCKKERLKTQITAYAKVHKNTVENDEKVRMFFQNHKKTFPDFSPKTDNNEITFLQPNRKEKILADTIKAGLEQKLEDRFKEMGFYLGQAIGWTLVSSGISVMTHLGLAVLALSSGIRAYQKISDSVEAAKSEKYHKIIPSAYKAVRKEKIELSTPNESPTIVAEILAHPSNEVRFNQFFEIPKNLTEIEKRKYLDEKSKYLIAYDVSCMNNGKDAFNEKAYYNALNEMPPEKRKRILNHSLKIYVENKQLEKQLTCENTEELFNLNLSDNDKYYFSKAASRTTFFSTPKVEPKLTSPTEILMPFPSGFTGG